MDGIVIPTRRCAMSSVEDQGGHGAIEETEPERSPSEERTDEVQDPREVPGEVEPPDPRHPDEEPPPDVVDDPEAD